MENIIIKIPNIPLTYVKSNKVRAIYFQVGKLGLITKQGKGKLPLLNTYLKDKTKVATKANLGYYKGLQLYISNKIVCYKNLLGEHKLVANPTRVGKPNIMNIKFNDFWGGLHKSIRGGIVNTIKDVIGNYLVKYPIPPVVMDYPLLITVEVHSKWEDTRDGDYAKIYEKIAIDALVNKSFKGKIPYNYPPVIKEDYRVLVRAISYPIPIPENTDVKPYLIIKIEEESDVRVLHHIISLNSKEIKSK